MSKSLRIFIFLFCLCFLKNWLLGQEVELDILKYELSLEPDIQKGFIQGEVLISFIVEAGENSISLSCGNLTIDEVKGKNVHSFLQKGSELFIELSRNDGIKQEISICYHGSPKRGLIFNSTQDQAHTIYFTEQWMPCNFTPGDKARISLNIWLPKEKQCIASGELLETQKQDDKTLYRWIQEYESPAYTYGFAIGTFTAVQEHIDDISLNYYSSNLKEAELKKVFQETANILRFFEQKSGIPYVQNSYSQVLIGSNYQEMSGFSLFSSTYPESVFKDSSEIHLTAHELAHQWWGNMITCESFDHFWLNEAFAVYMASAFNEYRFGKEKYQKDIALYKGIYEDLLKRGKDKALVFRNWVSSRDNRNVVYYKGAYVLHLLREEMGEEAFWKGIRLYSKRYYGKFVNHRTFQISYGRGKWASPGSIF